MEEERIEKMIEKFEAMTSEEIKKGLATGSWGEGFPSNPGNVRAAQFVLEKRMAEEKITIKEIYSNLVQLTIHSEEIAWNRFNNFLLGNSILILAWAALLSSADQISKKPVLFALCILGLISSIFWSGLGYRSRKFLIKHIAMGAYIEADPACWPSVLNQKYKPFSQIKSIRDTSPFGWCGGRYILIFGPLLFAIFYIFLGVISCRI